MTLIFIKSVNEKPSKSYKWLIFPYMHDTLTCPNGYILWINVALDG